MAASFSSNDAPAGWLSPNWLGPNCELKDHLGAVTARGLAMVQQRDDGRLLLSAGAAKRYAGFLARQGLQAIHGMKIPEADRKRCFGEMGRCRRGRSGSRSHRRGRARRPRARRLGARSTMPF